MFIWEGRNVAQFGSVRVLGTRGRRFESCHSDYKKYNITPLVQLVERRFPKPDAVGSSPTGRVRVFLFKNEKEIFNHLNRFK